MGVTGIKQFQLSLILVILMISLGPSSGAVDPQPNDENKPANRISTSANITDIPRETQMTDPSNVTSENVTEETLLEEEGLVTTTRVQEDPVTPPPALLDYDELVSIPGPWACDSEVYCQGPLLDAIQRNRLFKDSKTFVDMPLKDTPENVLKAFETLPKKNGEVSKETLKKFLEIYFEEAGHELDKWTPPDWTDKPSILDKIKDHHYREWAMSLNKLWKVLGRRVKEDVFNHTDRHSIIPVPNGFIIPGDRFREYYYWDTFFIIEGLLLSDMVNTTRGILENMLHMVYRFGFVPNGGRVYYTNRSQPPLLAMMVNAYYEASKDDEFIKKNFFILDKEYKFWMRERTVAVEKNGKTYNLARYSVNLTHPRPEGYMEDLETVRGLPLNVSASKFSMLASGAESGWDFSTRWFSWGSAEEMMDIRTIKTADIVPVDLNTFLYLTEKLMAKFAKISEHSSKVTVYEKRAELRLKAIEAVLWHEEEGTWYDYDLREQVPRARFYVSNIAPLLIYADNNEEKVNRTIQYLKEFAVLHFPGGLPTSLLDSGQQWDLPNTWAPTTYLATTSLANSNNPEAQRIAYQISNKWLHSAYKAWKRTGNMFEKYSATEPGKGGDGGEYPVQLGFGWTNGYVLHLLDRYSDQLEAPNIVLCN